MLKAPYKQGRIRSYRTLERGAELSPRRREEETEGLAVGASSVPCQHLALPQSAAVRAYVTRQDGGSALNNVSLASPHGTPGKWVTVLILLIGGEMCFLLTALFSGSPKP